MAFIRRRYYFWLLRAYLKKWRRTIFLSVIIGIIFFFIAFSLLNFYVFPQIQKKIQRIGYWGIYTTKTLPQSITDDISFGLTKVSPQGEILPSAASSWEIKNNGRTYVFHLTSGLKFHDGKVLTSENMNLNFKDVSKKKLDKNTVQYDLGSNYSPFLAALSEPIFKKTLVGLGEYEVGKLELNAGFVKSLSLTDKSDGTIRKNILFYPTQEALKTAFVLGEIDKAGGLTDLHINAEDLSGWRNVKVEKGVDYTTLVTLFYDTVGSELSNKKLRQALDYAIPDNFAEGVRAYSPIPPTSIYFSKSPNYGVSDTAIAKTVLTSSNFDKKRLIEISTFEEYSTLAKKIQDAWSKIGVKSKVKIVSEIPTDFQVFLYPFKIPKDPDQYELWHSGQFSNITRYKNLRIDKLLEDGRLTSDTEKRKSIYADFQKYLIDDVPATFLYFPANYTISRK